MFVVASTVRQSALQRDMRGSRVIEASAPIRICDNGGWTDTWFGGPGRVLNIAVTPAAEVSIRTTGGSPGVLVDAENFGDRYTVIPGASRRARHPLLEAAIDALPPPAGVAIEVGVRTAVPPGCGTGTSAAVAVALLGALAAVRSQELSSRDVAYAAHRLEVEILGLESGIQDQLAAAFGGISYLEIELYPQATVHTLPTWEELNSRLTLVFLGRAHHSSDVHRQVIERAHDGSSAFARLRDAAVAARDAIVVRDLDAFGRSMIANTDAQQALHPGLVGVDARRVIELAAWHGAVGWKVNGAGGDGGSVTILSATPDAKDGFDRRVVTSERRSRVLPVQLSSVGLRVTGAL
jgi:D-glycero-alpha-D-manno-heptose-7-phosphate kinase